ncbi:uncharacterized protein BJ212DRAFT_1298941 [Suillus subaureus]|uniref:Protein kinase domain-containing protein n=1 Tax=Suillus subaureus TaxID=48587 RepID=A0A9P7JET3_9AGAM|nr:uncharacterized protein BJ212DRAFT_1298941 [Suillus subaureus]KAG1818096.1 hypothetical protein BJ212DRAFT_1298941 [Suillus subaureus]
MSKFSKEDQITKVNSYGFTIQLLKVIGNQVADFYGHSEDGCKSPPAQKIILALPQWSHFHNQSTKFVAKLFWPEEAHQSEPKILKEVYEIAQDNLNVLGHIPEMVLCHKFEECSHTLYLIMFKKLDPIMMLSGKEFLLAWWEAVKCHYALWKRDIHHCNISPSNLMGYHFDG